MGNGNSLPAMWLQNRISRRFFVTPVLLGFTPQSSRTHPPWHQPAGRVRHKARQFDADYA